MGASPMLLLVTSTARTSSVSSSMPMCILRQIRRLEPATAPQCIAQQCTRGMFARIPLAFTFGFDLRAIDKKVQWPFGTAVRQPHAQCLLTTA